MSKSKGEAIIEEKLSQLEPGTPRYQVLAAALQFKSSWVHLGEVLTTVRTSKLWREWDYKNFGEFCKEEIRITSETAAKLVRSYLFLSDTQPALVQAPMDDQPPLQVPDYRSVDLLAKMRDNDKVPEPIYQDLSRATFEQDLGVNELRRRLKEEAPQAFTSTPRPASTDPAKLLRQALSQCGKLVETLGKVDGIDSAMLTRAEDLHGMIGSLLKEMQ